MTAAATLQHWATLGVLSATNLIRVGRELYSWDSNPREQKNGALVGRVYVQRAGETFRDIGHFKIAPCGAVQDIPAVLAGILVAAPPAVSFLTESPPCENFAGPYEVELNRNEEPRT